MKNNSPALNLSFSSYPDKIADLFHFMAEDESGCTGFGTDSVESRALLKAATECAERYVMKSLVPHGAHTSSGFAGHSIAERARTRASLELIERDALLLGWISGIPPRWLVEAEISQSSRLGRRILRGLVKAGFQPQIGLVANTGGVLTVVGVLRPSAQSQLEFGAVLASAAGNDLEACMESICFELSRAGTVILNRKKKMGRIFTPNNTIPTDGRSTFDYYLNPSHIENLQFYFEEGRTLSLSKPQISISEFECAVIEPALDLRIARAESAEMQQLFFGFAEEQKINLKRLVDCGLSIKSSSVMPLP